MLYRQRTHKLFLNRHFTVLTTVVVHKHTLFKLAVAYVHGHAPTPKRITCLTGVRKELPYTVCRALQAVNTVHYCCVI